jgi:Cu(I)/Ag(I) efflux system periplasmic protein CusF
VRRIDMAVALVSGSLLAGGAYGLAVAGQERASTARRANPQTYRATGTIRSFGPGRAYVNIAHEEIPGYMAPMVMSFWPQRVEQLDGLAVSDRVEFEFTETEDGRRVLTSMRKRP